MLKECTLKFPEDNPRSDNARCRLVLKDLIRRKKGGTTVVVVRGQEVCDP